MHTPRKLNPVLATLLIAIPLSFDLMALTHKGFAAGAIPTPQPTPTTSFLNWLLGTPRNQDEDEATDTKRGDYPCLASFMRNQNNNLWTANPTFIVKGAAGSLALFQDGIPDPIWVAPVTGQTAIPYDGPSLQPGITYILRSRHVAFPNATYDEFQFTRLSGNDQIKTTLQLIQLDRTAQAAGQSPEEIALARADYFWQHGLTADAWTTVSALPAYPPAQEAIQAAVTSICDPSPEPSR